MLQSIRFCRSETKTAKLLVTSPGITAHTYTHDVTPIAVHNTRRTYIQTYRHTQNMAGEDLRAQTTNLCVEFNYRAKSVAGRSAMHFR